MNAIRARNVLADTTLNGHSLIGGQYMANMAGTVSVDRSAPNLTVVGSP